MEDPSNPRNPSMEAGAAVPAGLVELPAADLRIDEPREDALIAEGAYGAVYRGTLRGQDVAIKEMRLSIVDGDRSVLVDVSLREARVQASCNDSGVTVPLLGYTIRRRARTGEIMGIQLAMPLGQESLQDWLAVHRDASADTRIGLAIQCAECVRYLHGRNITHQDLKPSNFILYSAPDGGVRVMVSDFGQARLRETALSTNMRFSTGRPWGTPEFAPPESMQGLATTPASDVWSLGLTLACLFQASAAGPWDGLRPAGQDFGVFFQAQVVTAGARPLLRELLPEFRNGRLRDKIDLLHACLHASPGHRPSIDAVLAGLRGRYELAPAPERGTELRHVPRIAEAPADGITAVIPMSPDDLLPLSQFQGGSSPARPRSARSAARSRRRYVLQVLASTPTESAPEASAAAAQPAAVQRPARSTAPTTETTPDGNSGVAPDPMWWRRSGTTHLAEDASPPASRPAAAPALPTVARVTIETHAEDLALVLPDNTSEIGPSRANPDIDLAFLLDTTGSMGPYIRECAAKIAAVTADVKARFPGSKLRIAFVGYRDLWDGALRFAVKDFSEDTAAITSFISSQPATGGDDAAEDVAGGLDNVLALSWNPRVARIVIHFADAPAHGTAYNGGVGDSRATIDQSEMLEPKMERMAQRRMDYYFVRLTAYTDAMTRVMSTAYDAQTKKNKPMEVINMGTNVAALLDTVKACITASMASYTA